jgi:hypothetical protein
MLEAGGGGVEKNFHDIKMFSGHKKGQKKFSGITSV